MYSDSYWPICATCHKPVETIVQEDDEVNQILHVAIKCHGVVEKLQIPHIDLLSNDYVKIPCTMAQHPPTFNIYRRLALVAPEVRA